MIGLSIIEANERGYKIVLASSSLNLTCKVNSTYEDPSEIRWYNNDFKKIPRRTYRVVNNDTVLLTLDDVGDKGIQHYHCGFDKRHLQTIRLYIGSK